MIHVALEEMYMTSTRGHIPVTAGTTITACPSEASHMQVMFYMLTSLSSCSQAPRPSTGPHKLRECLPLIIFLRNRLKYALTGDEVKKICMQRFIKIDGKVRTDVTYPAGFMGKFK